VLCAAQELLARYNAVVRSRWAIFAATTVRNLLLKPELLAKLKVRLEEPPPDGGLWTSGKVADWMAGELGRCKVRAQRGWEALKAIGENVRYFV
jgi:hypothetical protein